VSNLTDRELAIRQRLKDDFEHYALKCLKIGTKAGGASPFQLRRVQRYLHERLEAQLRTKGKVRAIVLKGRQMGVSTYIAGRFYWKISHKRGVRAFILTHLDTASNNLFNFAKRFHDNCPELVRPQTGKANAKELSFSLLDSGYKVATAGTAEVGRSETIQFFHGSEVAFWPNAQNHTAGIKQAIADAPGTEDIQESTANGMGNAFFTNWKAAERGESDYEAIFLPWFWHEEYVSTPEPGWTPPQAWRDYQQIYELDITQTHWAWRRNREMAATSGGSAEEPCWQFKQEYPATSSEAFQMSGEAAFINADRVALARKAKVESYGPIILGVDPARGGGDKTGIIDRRGRRLGENVCKRIDYNDTMLVVGEVRQIIRQLRPLGLRKVVIDVTGLGSGVYDRLRETEGSELVQGVNFSHTAFNRAKYVNRRAEMWGEMRDWFEDPASVQIPDSDDLQGELCAPVFGNGATAVNSSGQLVLESKDHIKKRLGASPDLGDACALTFGANFSPEVEEEDEDDGYRAERNKSTGY